MVRGLGSQWQHFTCGWSHNCATLQCWQSSEKACMLRCRHPHVRAKQEPERGRCSWSVHQVASRSNRQAQRLSKVCRASMAWAGERHALCHSRCARLRLRPWGSSKSRGSSSRMLHHTARSIARVLMTQTDTVTISWLSDGWETAQRAGLQWRTSETKQDGAQAHCSQLCSAQAPHQRWCTGRVWLSE